ncbi:hypothetical protein SAMN05444483_105176 [Salegentibacter echinorum]|uniref:Tetratricopeptide repeat-containing protein n=1 Tax=Salegentibacter echinorum TaxID=1073325 RepID=A0A1M5HJJ2_SALEC|nr:hypothetical protein [Salegentibacter echinorum]SHG16097.1 hypothetical protein SAMN05444483_105176 [Salegentibacter echinorum]
MKYIAAVAIFIFTSFHGLIAQVDDSQRISLGTYIPNSNGFSNSVQNYFGNKLASIASANGMGGTRSSSQFIITGAIDIISKDITPTTPPMHAYTIDVTFIIGDGINGVKYSSETRTVKGVGTNETKALISAIKGVNPRDPEFKQFVAEAKNSIIQHYNTNCDILIKKAQTLAAMNKYDEAIYSLSNVPEVSQECYNKSMEELLPIYQEKIDQDCQIKFNEANLVWTSNQNLIAADKAGRILAGIDPQANCYSQAIALSNKIGKKVKELNDRDYEFMLKQEQARIDDRKATVQAIRAIGEAYGNGQPQNVSYNVRGWW